MQTEPLRPSRPSALVPINRGLDLRVIQNVLAKMTGPSLAKDLEPRKGATTRGMLPLQRLQQSGLADKPVARDGTTNFVALKALANRDDIIWSIRSTIRRAIGEMKWKVAPDLDAIKADLKRWETTVLVNLALPGFGLNFKPQTMSMQIFEKASGSLREVLREALKQGEEPATSPTIRNFFSNVQSAHEAIALSHVESVERIFRTPNNTQKTFRELMDLIIDDITLYDAGVIIKNATLSGDLGELYHLPGWQIRPYRAKDRTIPQPPHVAYDWIVDSITKAYFNNAEVCYVAANPQESGYGLSPCETIIDQMLGAVYGDAYLIDGFINNNLPYFVFDCGPTVQEGERRSIEKAWDQRVSQGGHRGIFVANAEGIKGFMPVPSPTDKDSSTIEKLKFWANRKCAAYGLSLNDIGFTEDLHRTTSETSADLSQTRGIDSFAVVLEEKLNVEIVQGMMWVRDDPENTNALAGSSKRCFEFSDVRLGFERGNKEDRMDKAEQAMGLVTAGIWSINEERKEMDLPPIPGGDVHVAFGATGGVKIEDLPNLPAPADPAAQQGAPGAAGGPDEEAPGAPGQEDPNKPGGGKGAAPGAPKPPPPPKPPDAKTDTAGTDPTTQKMTDIERVADRLRKLVS
jgi:hypothetical protein